MYDDPLVFWEYRVGIVHPRNERNVFVIQKQPKEQDFFGNIFKLKPYTFLAFVYAQISHFELESKLKGQLFWLVKSTLFFQVNDKIKP